MDSAKIFALGLAAGLAIHVFMRNSGKAATKEEEGLKGQQGVSITKSVKKNKNKKKGAKDTTAAAAVAAPVETVKEVTKEVKEAVAKQQPPAAEKESTSAPASKKNKKKSKANQQPASAATAATVVSEESYAAVAESTPALNNETIRARADATQTAFTASLGDMRDAQVDPLPSGYSSVARIPAAQVEAPQPKLSKKDVDEGWSSVGGSSAKVNASSAASTTNNGVKPSIASTNPFAALPDDATTSSVRRIPAKPAKASAGGWTVASSSSSKPKNLINANGTESKKQRSNANKTQARKAAKEEAEKLQAERLANHRRQQALEAANQREVSRRPTPHSTGSSQPSSKVPTAKASVDLNGRLVWD